MEGHLDWLHHHGHDVGVLLQLGLQGLQVIVGDDLKARHEGPEAAKALRIWDTALGTLLALLQISIALHAAWL